MIWLVTQYNRYITALRKYLGAVQPGLSANPHEALPINPYVNLTVSLERMTTVTRAVSGNLNLSASAAFVPAIAVPAGQKWHITNLYRGTTTGSGFGFGVHIEATGTDVYLGKSGTSQGELVTDFWLNETDQIGMFGTNNGADGAIIFSMLYEAYTYTEVS